jgi:hypothetical protein
MKKLPRKYLLRSLCCSQASSANLVGMLCFIIHPHSKYNVSDPDIYHMIPVVQIRIRDQVPFRPLDLGSGMGKKLGSGSGMNNPDHISESLETIFWVKILKFFDADPGSGMEKIRIRDGRNSDPGSGINIPDPQHCMTLIFSGCAGMGLYQDDVSAYTWRRGACRQHLLSGIILKMINAEIHCSNPTLFSAILSVRIQRFFV